MFHHRKAEACGYQSSVIWINEKCGMTILFCTFLFLQNSSLTQVFLSIPAEVCVSSFSNELINPALPFYGGKAVLIL